MVGQNAGAAEDFLAASSLGLSVLGRVREVLAESHPDVTERVGRSQVAFRRRRGFAYLWMPGQYLRNPRAEVVLSLALPSRLDSPRFAEVVHPASAIWMHHLDVHATADVDDEVAAWLVHAADAAGPVAT